MRPSERAMPRRRPSAISAHRVSAVSRSAPDGCPLAAYSPNARCMTAIASGTDAASANRSMTMRGSSVDALIRQAYGRHGADPRRLFSALALTPRAVVAGAVHERSASDRPAAPRAGLPCAPVGVQRVREGTGLPVHVHVLCVEAGAALGQGLLENEPHLRHQAPQSLRRQRYALGLGMDAGRPERLVGVDVADAADQGLIQQDALD